jgi:septal ring factor EnvC (AmiA/AmiB activator)
MKKMTYFPTLLLFVQFCFVFSLSQAQVDKNAAAVQKLETGITNAKNNVAKNEKMLAVADSLVNKGTAMINESKAEAKAIAADRKKMDKEYATSRKALEKLSFAKDKAEVTKAKADLKVLMLKIWITGKSWLTRILSLGLIISVREKQIRRLLRMV